MVWFDMSFEHVCDWNNMLPNALSHSADLVSVMLVLFFLLDRIRAVYTAALRDLWETLVDHAQVANGMFTMSKDGLVC